MGKILSPFLYIFYVYCLWVIITGLFAQAGGCTWKAYLSGEEPEETYEYSYPLPPERNYTGEKE